MEGFVPKNIIQNFNTSIKYLDFSVDSNYLLIKDNLDEVIFIEIHSKKIVNIADLNYEIEWMYEGLKYSDKFDVKLILIF